MSIAEVNVYEATDLPPPPATAGSWGLTVDLPLVPVSAAIGHTSGRLIVWSSFSWNGFVGASGHQTVTANYDTVAQTVSSRTVTNTDHDMFCEGLSIDAEGRIVAAGGNSDRGTSIYESISDGWSDGGVSDPSHFDILGNLRSFIMVPEQQGELWRYSQLMNVTDSNG